ncbi:MAG: FeoB-associated Cys-rich membrane protein [Ruminococcaceae bacterium]|nr:FeoB-associated Cys-rich membrane protein [Oscillospiraceae bacterium]
MIQNIIIIAVIALIVAAIVIYLVREKKKGVTCVGCPYAKECAKRKNGGCSAK